MSEKNLNAYFLSNNIELEWTWTFIGKGLSVDIIYHDFIIGSSL